MGADTAKRYPGCWKDGKSALIRMHSEKGGGEQGKNLKETY